MLPSINSDDPSYFRAYLNENLIALQEEGQFSKEDLITLVENSFKTSWLSEKRKMDYLDTLKRYTDTVAVA